MTLPAFLLPFALTHGEKDPKSLRYVVEARPKAAQAIVLKPGLPVTVIL